jgi:hypothetical protein
MEGGGIRGSTAVGLLADAALVTLTDTEIEGTLADTSTGTSLLGRGVQVQSFSSATLSRVSLTGNADAGLFSVASLSLDLSGGVVRGTTASALPGGDGSPATGDGIVAIRGADAASWPVDSFSVSLADAGVDGNARAGVLLEDVTLASVSGLTGTNGYEVDGDKVIYQGDADVSAAADSAVEAPTPLSLNLEAVLADVP